MEERQGICVFVFPGDKDPTDNVRASLEKLPSSWRGQDVKTYHVADYSEMRTHLLADLPRGVIVTPSAPDVAKRVSDFIV